MARLNDPGIDADWFPLSPYQERIWRADCFAGSAAYLIPLSWRLIGPVCVPALESAWAQLQQHHDALRIRVRQDAGTVLQSVQPPNLIVPLMQASAEAGGQLPAGVCSLLSEPFDLRSAPPLRGAIVRIHEQAHVLVIALHHVAVDGWAVGLLLKELSRLYDLAARQQTPTPASRPGLREMVQAEALHAEPNAASDAFWRDRLATVGTGLLFGRASATDTSDAGDSLAFDVPAALAATLKRFALDQGCSIFEVLVSVLQVLLWRVSGADRFRIGYPVARRTGGQRPRVVSCLINTLVLPATVEASASLKSLLAANQQELRLAGAHEDVRLERLQALPAGEALFDVLINYNRFDQPSLRLAGLDVETLPRQSLAAPYAQSWIFSSRGESLGGRLEFATGRFSREAARWQVHLWLQLLAALLAEPDRPLDSVPLLTPQELQAVLRLAGRAPPTDAQAPLVLEHFDRQVARAPDKAALSCDGRQLSYRQLDKLSDQLAAALVAAGAAPDKAVAVWVQRGVPLVVSLLGTLKSGAMYVPLDPSAPEAHVRRVLADCGARLMVTDLPDASSLADLPVQRLTPLPPSQGTVLPLADPVSRQGRAPRAPLPAEAAYCLYTSGSTGQPKGVVVPHRALAHHIAAVAAAYAISPSDKVLQFASAAFDTSLEQILCALIAGATVVARGDGPWSIDELEAHIRSEGVTVADVPLSYCRLLVREADAARDALGLRLLIVGGEPVHPLGMPLAHVATTALNAYGPTETGITCTLGPLDDVAGCLGPYVCLGRPVEGTQLLLLDERLRPVPPGVVGELFVSGPRLARGYLGQAALTAERFLPNPHGGAGERMYRTGDLGRLLPDGRLEFLGRRDLQVKVRGVRVELGEVECLLMSHPLVRAAAAWVADDGDGHLVAGLVLQEQAGDGALHSVMRLAQQELPAAVIPAQWHVMAALPLTVQGKVDRQALRKRGPGATTAPAGTAPGEPALSPTLALLLPLLNRLCPSPIGDIDASLSECGIHSLVILHLLTQLKRQFGVELKPREVLKAGSVRRIAELVDDRVKKPQS